MAPKYRLTYFPVKALGEPIRLLLAYGKIDFEDIRVEDKDWPKLKESTPLGQMPILEIDGKVYHQSVPLARYLAKKVGLAGSNELQDLEIDIAVEIFNDFRAKLAEAFYESDEEIKEKRFVPLLKETIPFFLKKLEERIAENNGYLALGKLTWADLWFVGGADYMSRLARQDVLEGHPGLKALHTKVLALPEIKAWYAKAPATEY